MDNLCFMQISSGGGPIHARVSIHELHASRRQNNSQTATRRQNSPTIDECICFYFIKYCMEMPGESVTSYLLMNINELAMAMAVSSGV